MEFDLIARIRDRAASRADVVLGIGDDAALLQPSAGTLLVVAMDTLNSGVHFPSETAPAGTCPILPRWVRSRRGAPCRFRCRMRMPRSSMGFSMGSLRLPRNMTWPWSAATPPAGRCRCA